MKGKSYFFVNITESSTVWDREKKEIVVTLPENYAEDVKIEFTLKDKNGYLLLDTYAIDDTKPKDFTKPVEKKKNGEYKIKSGIVYLCFSTDFLIEEADGWHDDCRQMIRQRQDCTFLFLTKRIDRFMDCVPDDWGNGYENVIVCCTIENQKNADNKLSIFKELPIKHKCIIAQPLIEAISLEKYLDGIELVVVGGESDRNARPLDYNWVLDIREQCIQKKSILSFVNVVHTL